MNIVKRRAPVLSETAIFGFERITPSTLSVAHENYQASSPPLRHLNITAEILKLIRSHATKMAIHSQLQEASSSAPSGRRSVYAREMAIGR